MEHNPYAPPKAAVADVAPPGVARTAPFFAVSRTKLVVMCLLTFTAYELVWFYKNWARQRARGAPVLPLMRSIFAVDAINRDEAPDHDPNSRFTVWNWLWMLFGGLLTFAGVLGTLLPEP